MAKHLPRQLQYAFTSWLMAVTLEYLRLPKEVRPLPELTGLAQMSGLRVLAIWTGLMVLWNLLPESRLSHRARRWLPVYAFGAYGTSAVINSFTWPFFGACLLVMGILLGYAHLGWDQSTLEPIRTETGRALSEIGVGVAAGIFFLVVSAWTVARVYSFSVSTFDFGIFAQMFYNMKETGLPVTTLERDGLLNHFAVHVSPIYYLMLPVYCLVPRPEILQVLQAAVLASAVIPLWKLGKHHGLAPALRMLVCWLLLLYPAYAGGASYDLHENCFLTPLLLWLLYGIDRKRGGVSVISALLTCMVKEDAAVYVAIIGLYLLLRSCLREDKWGIRWGCGLVLGALGWFLAVTSYLANSGQGVMNYRYENFIYDDSDSLVTVIKAVLLCPMKAVFESVDAQKLKYIGFTMVPLVGLPLATRRYERLLLMIPYVLVNLMSDYKYQHDILYQYGYGSAAFLLYLILVNGADWKLERSKYTALILALCISHSCFYEEIVPLAKQYVSYCSDYADYYETQRQVLDTIPEEASVAATTFYTTYLSRRPMLHDIRYDAQEHVLACEYIVIKNSDAGSFKKYAVDGENGRENFVALVLENGYVLQNPGNTVTEVYRKSE